MANKPATRRNNRTVCDPPAVKHQVNFFEYDNPDDMTHDQIIEQCLSPRLRPQLLREPDLTLEKTMTKYPQVFHGIGKLNDF